MTRTVWKFRTAAVGMQSQILFFVLVLFVPATASAQSEEMFIYPRRIRVRRSRTRIATNATDGRFSKPVSTRAYPTRATPTLLIPSHIDPRSLTFLRAQRAGLHLASSAVQLGGMRGKELPREPRWVAWPADSGAGTNEESRRPHNSNRHNHRLLKRRPDINARWAHV